MSSSPPRVLEGDDELLPSFSLVYQASSALGRMIQGIRTGVPYKHNDDDGVTANPILRAALWQAAYVIEKAYRRRYRVPWTAKDYSTRLTPRQDGRNIIREEALMKEFPPGVDLQGIDPTPEVLPTTIIDADDRILFCYLPSCVSPEMMKILDASVGTLGTTEDGLLDKKRKARNADQARLERERAKGKGKQHAGDQERPTANWRESPDLFRKGNCTMIPGVLTFSPAWWANQLPGPAATVKPVNGEGRAFLRNITLASALVGAILSQINLDLFEKGMAVMAELYGNMELTKDHAIVAQVIEIWFSPFSSASLIVNRETPIHRDTSGPMEGMEMVVTGGNYSNGRFLTPSFNRSWVYNPGCVVALMGKLVPHGVPHVDGERYCIAYFWRQRLFEAAGVDFPHPPKTAAHFHGVPTPLSWYRDPVTA
ncbi:hypothetical protein CC1G_08110 [Coprinopsis cinerea okayama7|uniref:2OGFeDO JBP1/TET oxygenase domain-containing protein n=1 Tax=Coprinopsis cinerea (strain Okayama-7 / 130 / ATCC MYA-4618 / FGSC 9003) TaxID=240176 RepID=A8NVJ0_COPC7|nr:hypothetical protein CC1G_08110 [Coprinopsis cinerea okayama7\|eukprot:XP_001836725.2 hypothetical protein CC1G_08110 [Coprinopsis cinerea okayama7\